MIIGVAWLALDDEWNRVVVGTTLPFPFALLEGGSASRSQRPRSLGFDCLEAVRQAMHLLEQGVILLLLF
jgi:hypothetical protein